MNKLTGQGCPTNKLQGAIGQFYENANNGDIYECQSILKDCDGVSCYNWVLRASGDHIDDHAEIFGSGGGSSSKYAQPDWGVEENSVILPETERAGAEAPVTSPWGVALEGGAVYTVDWNGVAYECEAKEADMDGMTIIYMGNGEPMGLEATGEPFIVMGFPDNQDMDGIYGMFMALDGTESGTVSVACDITHKIPNNYVVGTVMRATVNEADMTVDRTFYEMRSHVLNGGTVQLLREQAFDASTIHTIFNLVYIAYGTDTTGQTNGHIMFYCEYGSQELYVALDGTLSDSTPN